MSEHIEPSLVIKQIKRFLRERHKLHRRTAYICGRNRDFRQAFYFDTLAEAFDSALRKLEQMEHGDTR